MQVQCRHFKVMTDDNLPPMAFLRAMLKIRMHPSSQAVPYGMHMPGTMEVGKSTGNTLGIQPNKRLEEQISQKLQNKDPLGIPNKQKHLSNKWI